MIADFKIPSPKRYLNADSLIATLRDRFDAVADVRRQASCQFSLTDTLTTAFAMFSLKEPSLLSFEERCDEEAIDRLFGIDKVPSDSQMREILDGIDIEPLNEAFADLFYELQRGGMLKKWVFDRGHYLLSIDRTGYFCSSKVRCNHCLERKVGGSTPYHHAAVAAVLTHPETKEVIPLAIEPIIKHLFEHVAAACDESLDEMVLVYDPKFPDQVLSKTQLIKNLPLNKSNENVRVNFLQHHQYDAATGATVKRFSWVTDIEIDRSKILLYQRGGRSRWRIENETFNTLKNQGYHYEHNYGHGKENLSTVLMLLMFLAFTVDQIQQACCPIFQAVLQKLKTRRKLWDHLRSHVRHFRFSRFFDLWATVLTGSGKNRARLQNTDDGCEMEQARHFYRLLKTSTVSVRLCNTDPHSKPRY